MSWRGKGYIALRKALEDEEIRKKQAKKGIKQSTPVVNQGGLDIPDGVMAYLRDLKADPTSGDKFRLPGFDWLCTLVRKSTGACSVLIDRGSKLVEIKGDSFQARDRRKEEWSPTTRVRKVEQHE